MTELVFILDRSGSMSGLESDTIGGFNSMLAQQKKEAGEALVSTVLFANDSTVIHDRLPLSEVPPLTEKEYFTCGCTALLDAVGGAIHHIGNIHKYARREDVPEKTMFIITTDGYENASRRYDYERVRRMIERQKERVRLGVFVPRRKHRRGQGGGTFRHRCGPLGELQVRRGGHGAELRGHQRGRVQRPRRPAAQRRLEAPHRRGRAEKREVSVCTERFWATSWAAPTSSTATTIRRRIFPCSAAVPTSPTTR